MNKALSVCLSILVLVGCLPLALAIAAPDIINPVHVFDSTCDWTGDGATVDVSGDCLKMTTTSAYGAACSQNGFVKSLLDIDLMRFYVKNTDSDVDLYVQFMDALSNWWWQSVTIKGGSDEFVAYDYPLDSFAYRFSNNGTEFNLVDEGTTWAQAKEANKLTNDNYSTYRMYFILNTSEVGVELSVNKMSTVKYSTDDTTRFVYDFGNAGNWTEADGGTIDTVDGVAKFANTASYGNVESAAGLIKQLTIDGAPLNGSKSNAADAIRIYVKNPGTAAVKLRFQYSDSYNVVRLNDITIAGNSDEFVAYDYKLENFITPGYDQTGVNEVVYPKDTTLKTSMEIDSQPKNLVCTYRMALVFIETAPCEIYIGDMLVVKANSDPGGGDDKDEISGEPSHTPNYDVFEDFNGYADAAALEDIWVNEGSSEGAEFAPVNTTSSGKAGNITLNSAGSATYRNDFDASGNRSKYDKIRIWAKGNGERLFIQLNMPVTKQTNGMSMVSFVKEISTNTTGKVYEIPVSEFLLPDWWEGAGNDMTIKPDISKIHGIYLVVIATSPANVLVDNIGFIEKTDGNPDPNPDPDPDPNDKPSKKVVVFDDFNKYSDSAALNSAWKEINGAAAEKTSIGLVGDSKGGKMMKIFADGVVPGYSPVAISESAMADWSKYESLSLWVKGNGETVVVQICCPVSKLQQGGSKLLPHNFVFTASSEGEVVEIPFKSFAIPEWWTEANGYDPNEPFLMNKITTLNIQVIGKAGSEILIDDIKLVSSENGDPGKPSPQTGDAGVAALLLGILALAGTGMFVFRKSNIRLSDN